MNAEFGPKGLNGVHSFIHSQKQISYTHNHEFHFDDHFIATALNPHYTLEIRNESPKANQPVGGQVKSGAPR